MKVFCYEYKEGLLQCYSTHQEKTCYGVATIGRLLKNYRFFAEYCLFYRALLQKRPIILRSLLIVATAYVLRTFISDI